MAGLLALSVIKAELREGPFAWPGGYPKFFLCADGETLSYQAAYENFREIVSAHNAVRQCPSAARNYADWSLVGYDVNWEDANMFCAHTGKRIDSAYGEIDSSEDKE